MPRIWTELSVNRIEEGTYEVVDGVVSVQHSDGRVSRRSVAEGDDPLVIARRMLYAHAREQCSPFWDPINYPKRGIV